MGAFWFRRVSLLTTLTSIFVGAPAGAQNVIIPDGTLGNESSQVVPFSPTIDLIIDGALRDQNLFHSFEEFSISNGGAAYFVTNADAIANIFARVTGGTISNIQGVLGTRLFDGTNFLATEANLFLINPNGIVFGENASLDVGGSFTATTADAIQFGDGGVFRATNPEAPSTLLTIDPSAYWFNQIAAGDIISRSVVPSANNRGFPGLRVPNRENLTLLGGNVTIDGRNIGGDVLSTPGIHALGGQINIGAVGGIGQVEVDSKGQLTFPEFLERADVAFQNGALANVVFSEGGELTIHAQNVDIVDGSILLAGIFLGLGNEASQAGDIVIDALGRISLDQTSSISNIVFSFATGNSGNIRIRADSLFMTQGGRIDTSPFGQGNAGDIEIDVLDDIFLDDSSIRSFIWPGAVGNGGDIQVSAGSLTLLNGAQLDASVLSDGQGNAGNITVDVQNTILLDGENAQEGRVSTIFSQVDEGGIGNGGDVTVSTGSLIATNGGRLQVNTEGLGNAGNLTISARDEIRFSEVSPINRVSSGALSNVKGENTIGNAGNIQLTTDSLFLTDGAQLDASTEGQGNSGNIVIDARDQVVLQGVSERADFDSAASVVFTRLEENAVGDGGNIAINATEVFILDGASLQAQTLGQGDAGNITINAAERLVLDGFDLTIDNDAGRLRFFQSSIIASTETPAIGDAGDVQITTDSLTLRNGAIITSSTDGQGRAGNISIQANDQILLDGQVFIDEIDSLFRTAISSQVGRNGNSGIDGAGTISVDTNSLSLTNGASFNTNLSGQGRAGNITITVNEDMTLDANARISSSLGRTGNGVSGNITIDAGSLRVSDISFIDTSTLGEGDAGDLIINVQTDFVLDEGAFVFSIVDSPLSLFVEAPILARGDAGDIRIQAGEVAVNSGGQISSSTFGLGNAGNITVSARDAISFDGSRLTDPGPISRPSAIFSIVGITGQGNGGDIRLSGDSLSLTNGAQLSASSSGQGNAGNIDLQIRDLFEAADGNLITSAVESSGGAITISAQNIRLFGDSDIRTNVSRGQSNGGNILLSADTIVAFDDSDILAFAEDGQGGDIIVRSPAFFGEDFQLAFADVDPNTLDGNGQVDLNASGAVNGVIEVPDTTLLENSFTGLEEVNLDTDLLTANSCIARADEEPQGSFVVTGRGGLAHRPGDAAIAQYPTGTVRTLPPSRATRPLQEPDGVYQLADGRLVLSHACSDSDP